MPSMFASIFIFVVTFSQLGLVALSYFKQWWELFGFAFYQLSPIMVCLGLLRQLGLFSGETSNLVWVGLTFCVVKYFVLARALVNEDPNFFNMSALLGEVLLIGGSSWYIVSYSYL